MTKPSVVIPPPSDAPGVLHVDTDSGRNGPLPTHDIGHESREMAQSNARETSLETIRRLAYAMWEIRGRPSGSSEVDWLAAEREVTGRNMTPVKRGDTGQVGDGLGLIHSRAEDLKEDGVTNPKDGRGPLRESDNQANDPPPKASPTPLK